MRGNKFINILTGFIYFLIWALPIWVFPFLPEEIPIHFDGSGMPDQYASRNHIWINPIIATLVMGLILYFQWHPEVLNYGKDIPEDQRETAFRLGTGMMQGLNVFLGLIFVIVNAQIIAETRGWSTSLWISLVWACLVFIFILSLVYVWAVYRGKGNKRAS